MTRGVITLRNVLNFCFLNFVLVHSKSYCNGFPAVEPRSGSTRLYTGQEQRRIGENRATKPGRIAVDRV